MINEGGEHLASQPGKDKLSESVLQKEGSLVGWLEHNINNGRLIEQYRSIKRARERARIANLVYSFLYDIEHYEYSPASDRDTGGWGIWEKYPEVFLWPFRRGRYLDLTSLTDWGAHAGLRVHFYSLLRLYGEQIDQSGKQALAHLLLSKPALVKLEEAGISTISDLELLARSRWKEVRLSGEMQGEIKRKLGEWRELPEE